MTQEPQAPGEMTLRERVANVIRPHVHRWYDDDNYSIGDIAGVLVEWLSTRDAARDAERKSWRCFYCDEVFTDDESARDHFGTGDNTKEGCACQITQDQKGLVKLLREAWDEVNVYRTENDAQTKLFYSLGSDHAIALRKAEEEGYEKGLADGRALSPAPQEADHDVSH